MGIIVSLLRGFINASQNMIHRTVKGYQFNNTAIGNSTGHNIFESSCFPGVPIFDQQLEGSCVLHALNVAYVCSSRRARERPEEVGIWEDASLSFKELVDEQSLPDPEKGVSFESALRRMGLDYHRLGLTVQNLKNCLANGHVSLVGFKMDSEMYRWQWDKERVRQTEFVMPTYSIFNKVMATHAVAVVGWYDDYFIVQNSWGHKWGNGGFFYMHADNISNGCVQDAFFLVT